MKKIFMILMVLVVSVSMLVGCGKNKQEQSVKNTVTSTQNASQNIKQELNTSGNLNTAGNDSKISISEDKAYTDKMHVAAYVNEFSKLPHNYITKNNAKKLGWQTKGTLDKVAPGKSIGGDRYGNYEGLLPKKQGRVWTECDIDYVKGSRNAKRIVFSNDGLIYYTDDHYKTFTKINNIGANTSIDTAGNKK